jgi:hypothetical protein
MSDLIPTTTDDEVWRYSEAANLALIKIDPAIVKGKALKYNPITGRNDILMPLTNGGYTKIGDEEVVLPVPPAQENISEPNQVFDQTTKSWVSNPAVNLAPAPTFMSGDNLPQVNLPNANLGFVEKRSPLRIEMTQPNDARFAEFQSVIGTADAGPTMADYEAAGFTPDEVSTFQTQAFEATMPADAMVPTPLTQAQIDQYVQEADSQYVSVQPGLPEIAVRQAANIVSEVGKGLARGTITEPANFLKDTFDLYDPLAFQLVDPQTGEFDPKILFMSREEKAALDEKMAAGEMPYAINLDDLISADPSTPIAGLAGGIAQFAGAYAGLGKLFRLNKGLVTAAGRGAGADFLAFGGDEGRLTDMLLEMGVSDAYAPDFFKTDPNDPDYIGRFKTALEGAALGAMVEIIGPLFRAIKNGDMSPKAVSQLLTDGRQKAKRFMVQQIDDAEQRVANNSGTLYSNPVGPLIDQALVAAGKVVGRARPGHISTRLPTAKGATEDPMAGNLVVGLEEMKAEPALYEFNVNITKAYPNMLDNPSATVDETAEQFIQHVTDNLLYLHDKVPEGTRTRSQLWYDGARKITDDWSVEYGVPDTSIAGVLAALSPQKDWYQNVSLGQRVLDVAIKQKDFKMSNEMIDKFFTLKKGKGEPVFDNDKYRPLLEMIQGKSYSEIIDPDPAVQSTLRALFVRLYDQTYNKPDYRIVGPEGSFLDVATNANGAPSKVAWGSLNEISKAVASIDSNGDVNTISRLMGERHKVRNFYNNIYDPNSQFGDVTIDTHAVAAGLLRPLSGNSLEVDHNFKNMSVKGRGTTKGSAKTGVSGNYGLYAEAYRRAAAERGILPRQMQSITWEAVRGLFTDKFKQSAKNVADVDAIWQRYKNGEIDLNDTRRLVDERAGGINPPTWQ